MPIAHDLGHVILIYFLSQMDALTFYSSSICKNHYESFFANSIDACCLSSPYCKNIAFITVSNQIQNKMHDNII